MIALALLVATATAGDPVLRDLEAAFVALDDGRQASARRLLVRATAAFEDTQLDGSDLQKAFASDRRKPYRGRPHERVLAHVVLAALEMQRGRCDLALPSLKSAAFFDLKAKVGDDSDAVVVHALTLRCLIDLEASAEEIGAARDVVGDARIEAAVRDPGARLVLDGRGPSFVPRGAQGEGVVAVQREHETRPIVIHLDRRVGDRHRVDGGVGPSAGLTVWSSFEQATTRRGRPFDKILADRARFAAAHGTAGQRNLGDGGRRLSQARSRSDIVAAGLVSVVGAGMLTMAGLTDARADDRFVDALPERVRLVGSRAR